MGAEGRMDFDLDELELAFGLHVAGLIVAADDELHANEAAFLARAFPTEELEASGFLADGERTERYHEAAMAALDRLPGELAQGEKLGLLELLVVAVKADGEVDIEEARALVDGGRLLELDDEVLEAFVHDELGLDFATLREE